MTEYQLNLTILGKDKASGLFTKVERSLSSIMNTALGMTLANIFAGIATGITQIAISAIDAVGYVQMLQVTLQSLATRELVMMSDGTKTVADVTDEASVKARGLIQELGRLAILSPYTLDATANTYKMMVAFGSTTDQAYLLTQGLLTMGAGLGAGNEQIQRMAYNLAQIAIQGKVTALDLRQLALAGLPLNDVLKKVGERMGYVIEDHLDFNKLLAEGKITWQDFVDTFAEYADTNFGNAAERMARTLYGLKSTFSDVFRLLMPRLIGEGVEAITAILSRLLDAFLYLYESPELERVGKEIGAAITSWVAPVTAGVNAFVTAVMQGLDFSTAIKAGLLAAFGSKNLETLKRFFTTIGTYLDFFKTLIASLGPVLLGIGSMLNGMFMQTLLPVLSQVIVSLQPLVALFATQLLGAIEAVIPIISQLADAVLPPLIAAAASVWATLLPVIATLLPMLTEAASAIVVALMPLITTLLPVLVQFASTIVAAALPLIGAILTPLLTLLGGLVTILSPVIETIGTLANELVSALAPILLTIVNSLLPPLIPIILQLVEALLPLITTLLPPLAQSIEALAVMFGAVLVVALDALIPVIQILADGIVWLVNNAIMPLVQWLSRTETTPLYDTLKALATGATESSFSLVTAFKDIYNAIKDTVLAAIQWLVDAWNNLKAAMVAVWNFITSTFQTAFRAVADVMTMVVGGAIMIVSNLWYSILLPALTAVWTWIQTYIIPIFQGVAAVLVAVFGYATRFVAALWNNILLPALQSVWGYIVGFVSPIFATLSDFFTTVFNSAVQAMSDLWNNTLLPAFTSVWSFIQGSVLPLFVAVGDYIASAFMAAWQAISDLWTLTLLPTLTSIWSTIQDKLLPIFTAVVDYLNEHVIAAFGAVATFIRDVFIMALDGLQTALQGVASWLASIADWLNKLTLPGWLTPGSPTPFEMGLRGIITQLKLVDSMSKSMQLGPRYMRGLSEVFNLGVPASYGRFAYAAATPATPAAIARQRYDQVLRGNQSGLTTTDWYRIGNIITDAVQRNSR